MNQRKKFEEWAAKKWGDTASFNRKYGAYIHIGIRNHWDAWSAALATPPVASGALPELPYADYIEGHHGDLDRGYTADQMRAYGQACAAAAAPNAALVGDWQPIETAPRDGSMILLGRPEDEACDRGAICTPGRWHEEDHDGPDNMGHDAGFMDIEYQEFSWGRSFGNPDYMGGAYQPTHWMPLPTAPSKP